MKIITENKQARFEYFVEETYKTGIVLEGAEVKSIRAGNINLKDSFCSLYRGEVFLNNTHIAVYDKSGAYNVKEARRDRRLLLHKYEARKIGEKVSEKGFTLVPLKLYFKKNKAKILLGLAKGKKTFDKRESIKERDIKRNLEKNYKLR
jgi:SsrA-binding protein